LNVRLSVQPARSTLPWIGSDWLLRLSVIGTMLLVWPWVFQSMYPGQGLFRRVAIDFGFYFAQASALWVGEPGAIYNLAALNEQMQLLAPYTFDPSRPLTAGHVPYPPLFAWLFTPLTWLPPPVGFALWTGLNLAATYYLARRVSQLFSATGPLWVALFLLTWMPLIIALLVGQPTILLACAVAECYLCLRAGRDLRAGLWLSLLLFKPQYGLLLGALLLLKGRWRAVAGTLIGAAVILAGSVVVAGLPTLLAYPRSIVEISSFRDVGIHHAPDVMVNWRALVMKYLPNVDPSIGTMLSVGLGGLTALALVPAWRGRWAPTDPSFAPRMALVMLATLLANYHSHYHGAVLLAVPVAAVLADRQTGRLARLAILAGVFVPAFTFMVAQPLRLGGLGWSARSFTVLTIGLFVLLLVDLWRRQRVEVATPAPVAVATPQPEPEPRRAPVPV
jgi:hypothetical protein